MLDERHTPATSLPSFLIDPCDYVSTRPRHGDNSAARCSVQMIEVLSDPQV